MYTLDQIHQKSYSPGSSRLVFAHFCAFHFISAPVSLPYIPCSRIHLQKAGNHRQHIPYNRFLYCTLSYLTLLFSTRSLCSSFNKRVLLKVSYINTTSKKVRKSALQFTRPPANADFCAKRRKIFFASRFYLTPMWITFVYTHACTLSSDLLADLPCIYMIFPDFPLLFCPVIHTLFFLFIPSSQSFCQPVFFLRSLFFAELFIINLSIQGRFFDE